MDMFASKQKNNIADPMAGLVKVMERFNESSSKLELQHTALMREVEDLREQLRVKDEEIKRSERLAVL